MSRKPLRIASYNMRKARGLDQIYAPERIIQVINGLGADVVALQEADHRLRDRPTALPRSMIETETDFQLIEVAKSEVSIGHHGNAVLARKSMGEAHAQRIELPGLEPRGAVRVDFQHVSVMAVHLGLLRSNRRMQLQAIRKACNEKTTVIAGDFNEWRKRRGLEPLADRFGIHAPGQSFHARRPVAALDRIALSEGLELRDAGVEETPLSKRASDHLPIWADVRIN